MSEDRDDPRRPDRTPASDRSRADDESAPEAEAQDGSLKVHGDKYERALEDSHRQTERGE
jgi:hypothetical protein